MQEELNSYINGNLQLHHIMVPLMNNKKPYYVMLGQYIENKFIESGKEHEGIDFFKNKIAVNKGLFKRAKRNDLYFSIGSFFLTSWLDETMLNRMYGEGIKHSHFGEGFDDKDYKHISYMVSHNDLNYHIGIDHRGTGIAVESLEGDVVYESLKNIVNLYFEKL